EGGAGGVPGERLAGADRRPVGGRRGFGGGGAAARDGEEPQRGAASGDDTLPHGWARWVGAVVGGGGISPPTRRERLPRDASSERKTASHRHPHGNGARATG